MTTTLLLILAYFVGSIPFGVWVAKARGVDILNQGSGNPGATNVWRTLGWKPGLMVFLLDTLKGAVPAVATRFVVPTDDGTLSFAAGMMAVVGHSLSPFIQFKGGKGVATGFGALLGSEPFVGLSAFAIFVLTVWITRYISLGSILAAFAVLAFGIVFGAPVPVLACYAGLAVFVIVRHRENIQRLRRGEERKFSLRSRGSAPATSPEPSDP